MTNENKTVPTSVDVIDFLATLEDEQQRRDSELLVDMMTSVSGERPVMWGTSIIGFGTFHYTSKGGREGDWMRIGFSPRKGKLSLYITYDASRLADKLVDLGKHKVGKGCIYITRLSDVDLGVLKRLVGYAWEHGPVDLG